MYDSETFMCVTNPLENEGPTFGDKIHADQAPDRGLQAKGSGPGAPGLEFWAGGPGQWLQAGGSWPVAPGWGLRAGGSIPWGLRSGPLDFVASYFILGPLF